jgi:type II secretory pathway component PulF
MFTLLRAGVSLHSALSEAIQQVTLPYSKNRLHQAITDIIAGKSLSTSLMKTHFFSRSAIQMIHSAEKTGQLDDVFHMLFQRYSQELSSFADHIGKAIEPFIIIVLGSIIGCIVIAIYLPIFQLGGLY